MEASLQYPKKGFPVSIADFSLSRVDHFDRGERVARLLRGASRTYVES
jgi:hypothetical protein